MSEEEDVNSERIKLLGKRHTEGLSASEADRLDCLTERMRQLVPRVTEEDFKRLEMLGIQIHLLQSSGE